MNYLLYYSGVDLIVRITSLILGLLAWGIVIIMTVITSCDVLYLTNSPIRGTIQRLGDGRKVRKGRIKFVSSDAVNALEESYDTRMNPLWIYVKKRCKAYIVSAVMLYILFAGPGVVLNMLIRVIGDMLEALKII